VCVCVRVCVCVNVVCIHRHLREKLDLRFEDSNPKDITALRGECVCMYACCVYSQAYTNIS